MHAPCLLITQRVWGTDPWGKLERSAEMATDPRAPTWSSCTRRSAGSATTRAGFVKGIADLERRTGVAFAVENMYPWRATPKREMQVYLPGWDPSEENYANATVDLSHSSTAQSDPLAMVRRLGPRMRHLHLADGSGSPKDEHLIPGRGNQPAGALLEHLATTGFTGHIVVEVNTRKAGGREQREADLAEALAFARLNFARVAP